MSGSSGPPPGMTLPGPPYLPPVAVVGGMPTVGVDAPVSGVLTGLFLLCSAAHLAIYVANHRRGHKFLFSLAVFYFCLLRVIALVLRIAFAAVPGNANLAVAAGVFTAAGVILLFFVNLWFALRLLRGYHPALGWHPYVTMASRAVLFSVFAVLIMVVVTTVYSFFTLEPGPRAAARDVQRFSGAYMTFLAFLPLPVVALGAVLARTRNDGRPVVADDFGTGRWSTKVGIVAAAALLLTLGAGFRLGTAFEPRPASNPAWFHHRAAYYCFNFVIDLIVSVMYAALRFDLRFHIPNGARGPGDYAAGRVAPSDDPEKQGPPSSTHTTADTGESLPTAAVPEDKY